MGLAAPSETASSAARRAVDDVVATACTHPSATAKTAAGMHAAAVETAATTVEAATTTMKTTAATVKAAAATAMEASAAAAMAATAATASLRRVCGDQAHDCAREERGEH